MVAFSQKFAHAEISRYIMVYHYALQDQNKESQQKLTRVIKEVHEIKQTVLEVSRDQYSRSDTCTRKMSEHAKFL